MKCSIFIDVDTEREGKPVLFGKPPDVPAPETQEETRVMILNDIACVTEGLVSLILLASSNNYGNKEELINSCIKVIGSLSDNKNDNLSSKHVEY